MYVVVRALRLTMLDPQGDRWVFQLHQEREGVMKPHKTKMNLLLLLFIT